MSNQNLKLQDWRCGAALLILHSIAVCCRWFFQQLVLVFDFYHRLGVKNREVRLHNLMLASDGARPVLKISDFEYSKTEQVPPTLYDNSLPAMACDAAGLHLTKYSFPGAASQRSATSAGR